MVPARFYIRINELRMDIRMTNWTVENLAEELHKTHQALLDLLKSAGVVKESGKDRLSEADMTQLLDHLRSTHASAGGVDAPKLNLVKRSSKSAQLRTQTQFEFDTPADTDIS
jgi:hypothetical protein